MRPDDASWTWYLKTYLVNWAILLDLACNTLIGGTPRETMSSRMGKAIAEDRCVFCGWVCWALDKIDPDHCAKSIDHYRGEDSGKDRNLWN